ncbi:Peptidyl-tRNA hydrolase [Spatholobus suberectus]|nr:Peptidyl-tRNA hydrolase [Spatholobus suberectus]
MDPKAFLLQKFNVTARQRVSCGKLVAIAIACFLHRATRTILKTGQVTKFFISVLLLVFLVGQIDEALQEGVDALKFLLSKGLAESEKRFNKEQKYKHLRVQKLPV